MGGNPLALAFLLLAGVFFALTMLIVFLQRRLLRDQTREIRQLLGELRTMADAGTDDAASDAADDAGRVDEPPPSRD